MMSKASFQQPSTMICVGAFAGAHGVHGRVRVKSFTQHPQDLFTFDVVYSEDGSKTYHFLDNTPQGEDLFTSHVKEISSREEAASLKSQKLYIQKSQLPELRDDEFYYSDLIGLEVRFSDQKVFGVIKTVHNYGAGDILEVCPVDASNSILLPFKNEMIPEVNLAQKYVLAKQSMVEDFLKEEAQ